MSTGPSAGGCQLHYDSYLESLTVYKEAIRGPEITAVHSSSLLKLPSAPKDNRGEFARGTQSICEEKKNWTGTSWIGFGAVDNGKACILNFLFIWIGCGIVFCLLVYFKRTSRSHTPDSLGFNILVTHIHFAVLWDLHGWWHETWNVIKHCQILSITVRLCKCPCGGDKLDASKLLESNHESWVCNIAVLISI